MKDRPTGAGSAGAVWPGHTGVRQTSTASNGKFFIWKRVGVWVFQCGMLLRASSAGPMRLSAVGALTHRLG